MTKRIETGRVCAICGKTRSPSGQKDTYGFKAASWLATEQQNAGITCTYWLRTRFLEPQNPRPARGGLQMENWTLSIIVGIAVMLMYRLDRLGKQLEAVSAMIRADVARTEEERDEILQEWKETKKQATKDERQFWLFWFVVIAAVGLYFNYFRAH